MPLTPLLTSLLISMPISGCLSSNFNTPSVKSSTTTSILTTPSPLPQGARAAKIIFKRVIDGGSFAEPPATGTVNAESGGVQATQVFNADDSVLATSTSSSSWPSWLSSVELGISGSSNQQAGNPDCARFSSSAITSDGGAQCKFKYPSADLTSCGAGAGYYRVSDYDCNDHSTSTARGIGSGLETDGVYIRAILNRDSSAIGPYENILTVLEYSASAMNAAPSNPSSCFNGGSALIESCSDLTWRIFTKHSVSETLQSFLLLVPPAFASINTSTGIGGSGVSTKQFIIPLAGDSHLKVLQISRTGLSTILSSDPNFANICAPNGSPANSALCVGMVFYSITFYRI